MKRAKREIKATRTDPSRPVRFPGDLLKRLDEAAARSGRSRNSEIVKRLWESLEQGSRKEGAAS